MHRFDTAQRFVTPGFGGLQAPDLEKEMDLYSESSELKSYN
jgi:hypothetical protein